MSISAIIRNMKIRYKLLLSYVCLFLCTIFIGSITVYVLIQQTITENIESEIKQTTGLILGQLESSFKRSIKNHLQTIAKSNLEIVNHFYNLSHNGQIPEVQAKKQAADVLLSQKIGETGYLYCITSKGLVTVHPELEFGFDASDFQFVQQQMVQKEGYIEYSWKNPSESKPQAKALYMYYFSEWDWIISASSYRKEFKFLIDANDLKKEILSVRSGKKGYCCILDYKGNPIIYPDGFQNNNAAIVKLISQDVLNRINSNKIGLEITDNVQIKEKVELTSENKKFLIHYNVLPEFGWVLTSVSFLDVYFAPLDHIRNIVFWVGMLSLFLTFLLSMWLNHQITHPIHLMISQLQQSDKSNFLMDIQSTDEIGQLAYYMRDYIKSRKAAEKIKREQKATEIADQAKSAFLANMSHEIRTPMNAILGLIALMKKTVLSHQQVDYIKKMERASKSLLRIINDILDFSKIEAGKFEIEHVNFELTEVIDNIADMFSNRAAEKKIELIFSMANNVPRAIIGDFFRLGQVLINLINNAIKFTDKGEVVVWITQEKIFNDKITLKFTVSDTGIGIDDSQIKTLFDPFVQASSPYSRRFGGTGLGLALCKQIVTLMNGQIQVKSEFNKGSTFIFTVDFELQPGWRKLKTSTPKELDGLKILIVDDNAAAREVLMFILMCFSFNPDAISSGESVLHVLEDAAQKGNAFDLLIVDWRMPGMDGLDIVRQIRENQSFSSLPLILMSELAGEEIQSLMEKHKINAFIVKPIKQYLLFDIILDLFSKKAHPQNTYPLIQIQTEKLSVDLETDIIKGMRILLVEDNRINREVAKELLSEFGIIILAAESGKEAIEMVNKYAFDLVLMDIEMPEMDGMEATKKIRSNVKHKNLPILAVTAHAIKGFREKCLNVGMNDYISKPFDMDEVVAVLSKYAKQAESMASVNHVSPAADNRNVSQAFIAHLKGIDQVECMRRFKGKKGVFFRLLYEFIRYYQTTTDEIRDAVMHGDKPKASRLAHTVKSISGNLCAYDLYRAANELEHALNDSHATNVGYMISEFERELKMITQSEKLLEKNYGALLANSEKFDKKSMVIDIFELKREFRTLNQLLIQHNFKSLDAMNQIKLQLGGNVFFNNIKQLDFEISRLEFEKAHSTLTQIIQAMEMEPKL